MDLEGQYVLQSRGMKPGSEANLWEQGRREGQVQEGVRARNQGVRKRAKERAGPGVKMMFKFMARLGSNKAYRMERRFPGD